MKYKTIITILTAVFVTSLLVSLSLLENTVLEQVDMVYINEVVAMVEANTSLASPGLYDYYTIKSVEAGYNPAINNAIKNRETIVDATIDSVPSKIIFRTNFLGEQERQRNRIVLVVIFAFAIVFILCILYVTYLHYTLYKPFLTLKRFALAIAGGNLDIPLKMDKSNRFGAFTESFDIMREELKSAKNKENQANNSKRELIASLSHDIKTPVASIKAVSELLIAIQQDDKLQSKYIIINEKAEQINRLITDMFNATLEELGELKVTLTECYSTVLKELINSCDYENKATIQQIPQCLIMIDSLRLGQVLDNVFANSYKYAKTEIDVNFSLTETHLEMDIHDFGNGINEDELEAIFIKFYRGSNVDTQSGSGLGLYISKYLMERQDGDIFCFNCNDGFIVKIIIKLV